MNMDNRIFNVNGSGPEGLLKALELVFMQHGENTRAKGWSETKTHGLILHWWENQGQHKLPSLTPEACLPFVLAWLESAEDIELKGWDDDADHDGMNSRGWRVYCEDWGRVNGKHDTICGILPVYLWHGK